MSTPTDDTFLLAHQILPLSYSFSSPISPISIRDQMIRAKMFVEHAIAANLLASTKKLLIVGGGAAGVSLAIEAAGRKIGVVLLEREKELFGLQRKAPDRWIDPTQYDWPLSNWTVGKFPCRSPLLPTETLPEVAMDWEAGTASSLALAWSIHLKDAETDPKLSLAVHRNATVEHGYPQLMGDRIVSRFVREGKATTVEEEFGCVVYALGFGNERIPDGNYRGFRYWDDDLLGEPDFGRPDKAGGKPITIAICGSGDGALQDFLRIATGLRSAKNLMVQLEKKLPSHLAIQLATEEDNARRHHAWIQETERDHPHLKRLHSMYEEAANQAASIPSIQDILAIVCGPILSRLTVNLYYSCDHFSQCFPLNHFLSLLILKWDATRGRTIRINDTVRLNGVEGVAPHACNGNQSECHANEHQIHLGRSVCGTKLAATTLSPKADIVIVRLGTDSDLGFDPLKGRSIPRTRQLLPFTPPLE